jgi:hypothetical protein
MVYSLISFSYIFKNKAWKTLEMDVIDNPEAMPRYEERGKKLLLFCWPESNQDK